MNTNIPPIPPLPQDDEDDRPAYAMKVFDEQTEAERQEENQRYVTNAMQDYLRGAVHELGSLMTNPKASSAQVKACELIINRMAGKGGRYVNIGDIQGKTVHEAMDMVFAAILAGNCSMEDGKELIDMLSKRAGREVEALGHEVARLTQLLDQRGGK
jgi:hypothetical protein